MKIIINCAKFDCWLLWILQKLSYGIPFGVKVYCGARDS